MPCCEACSCAAGACGSRGACPWISTVECLAQQQGWLFAARRAALQQVPLAAQVCALLLPSTCRGAWGFRKYVFQGVYIYLQLCSASCCRTDFVLPCVVHTYHTAHPLCDLQQAVILLVASVGHMSLPMCYRGFAVGPADGCRTCLCVMVLCVCVFLAATLLLGIDPVGLAHLACLFGCCLEYLRCRGV